MLTIGDFNSFWGFLGHPVQCPKKACPLKLSACAARYTILTP